MASNASIQWSDSDPRDLTAIFEGYSLRVKAEKMGTCWAVYVKGPDIDYRSEHVSKDSAKQKSARVVRELLAKKSEKPK